MWKVVIWLNIIWYAVAAFHHVPYYEYLYTRRNGVVYIEPLSIPVDRDDAQNKTIYVKNNNPRLLNASSTSSDLQDLRRSNDVPQKFYSVNDIGSRISNRSPRLRLSQQDVVRDTQLELLQKMVKAEETAQCVDGPTKLVDCNHCVCMGGQVYVCTSRMCNTEGGNEKNVAFKRETNCIEGEFIRSFDACNRCYCGGGNILCTRRKCFAEAEQKVSKSECTPGEKIPSPDGCNTCACNTRSRIVCTVNTCGPELDPNIKDMVCVPNTWYSLSGNSRCKECYCINGKMSFCYMNLCVSGQQARPAHTMLKLSLPGSLPDKCKLLDYMQDKCTKCYCNAAGVWSCKTNDLGLECSDSNPEGWGSNWKRRPGRPNPNLKRGRRPTPRDPWQADIYPNTYGNYDYYDEYDSYEYGPYEKPGRPEKHVRPGGGQGQYGRPGPGDRPGRPLPDYYLPNGGQGYGPPRGRPDGPRFPKKPDKGGSKNPGGGGGGWGGWEEEWEEDGGGRGDWGGASNWEDYSYGERWKGGKRPGGRPRKPDSSGKRPGPGGGGRPLGPGGPGRPEGRPKRPGRPVKPGDKPISSPEYLPIIPPTKSGKRPGRPIKPGDKPTPRPSDLPINPQGGQNIPDSGGDGTEADEGDLGGGFGDLGPGATGEEDSPKDGNTDVGKGLGGSPGGPGGPGGSGIPGGPGAPGEPGAPGGPGAQGGPGVNHQEGDLDTNIDKGPFCTTGQFISLGSPNSCQGCFCTPNNEWKCWSIKEPCRTPAKCNPGKLKKNPRAPCSVCYCGADQKSYCATDEKCSYTLKATTCEAVACLEQCASTNANFGVCHRNKCVCVQ